MKWTDFLEQVTRVDVGINTRDDPTVVIARSDPSVGPRASTALSYINVGFDWDHGKVLLVPSAPLYERTTEDEVAMLRKQLDGLARDLVQARRRIRELGGSYG